MDKKIILVFVVIILVFLAVLIFVFSNSSTLSQLTGQNALETGVIAKNLNTPWALDFLPDGSIIFTERAGKVSVLQNNTVKLVGTISVSQISESGLMGVAVDPEFSQNKYIYVYYTYGGVNRVSRFVLNDQLANEQVLLDNIPSSPIHNGGRIKFGPDGKLYVTTGDAGNSNSAQDINSLGGKILRLNKDGTVPSDNPFGNYVYSYGHRDPQGLAWNNATGILYESEHGATMNDEINIITKGGNYGWPLYQGNSTSPGYTAPVQVYTNFTLAPSGIAFYQNKLYIACLKGTQIRKLTLSNDGKTVIGQDTLYTNFGRLREVVEYGGYLHITTSNQDGRGVPQTGDDKIIKIKV
jgi:aldose sugar dehydrogenase